MDRQYVNAASSGSWQQGEGVSQLSKNKVLRNTYSLLALNLISSSIVAYISMAMGLPHPGLILMLVGFFGLLFLVTKFRDSAIGVGLTFVFTGFLGYTLGPILSHYLSMPGGGQIVATALGMTGVIFGGLSAWALVTKRDFSGFAPYLFVGILTAFVLGIVAYAFSMPALSLAVSAVFVLLMAGLILWETQRIVNGGETNYVMATTSLYVSIFNLFTSLMHLLGFASSD